MEAEAFPSTDESAAAISLLALNCHLISNSPLLSPTTASSRISPDFGCKEEMSTKINGEHVFCSTSSLSDSLSSDTAISYSGSQNYADPMQILAIASSYGEIKPKIVKKARSKTVYSTLKYSFGSICKAKKEIRSVSVDSEEDKEEGEATSSMSSTNNAIGSCDALPRQMSSWRGSSSRFPVSTSPCAPSGVRWRAAAIKEFLSGKWSSEYQIRDAFGDSPDTSKALRLLLKRGDVKRAGAGGRTNPFLYTLRPIDEGRSSSHATGLSATELCSA